MTGQHVASQCKLIFSEYAWPDTLVSDNGPCYTAETFTSMITEYGANDITSSPHYLQSNGLAERFVQIVKNFFHKSKRGGKRSYQMSNDIPKYSLNKLFTISNANLAKQEFLRSDLSMSNAARKQLGLDSELLRNKHKNEGFTFT